MHRSAPFVSCVPRRGALLRVALAASASAAATAAAASGVSSRSPLSALHRRSSHLAVLAMQDAGVYTGEAVKQRTRTGEEVHVRHGHGSYTFANGTFTYTASGCTDRCTDTARSPPLRRSAHSADPTIRAPVQPRRSSSRSGVKCARLSTRAASMRCGTNRRLRLCRRVGVGARFVALRLLSAG